MSAKHKGKQAPPPSAEPNLPTDLLFAYANFVSVTVGLYDMQLEFGVEMDGVRTPTARIAMSPQHAVSLQLILARLLKEYEANVGPIALPAEVRERLAHGQKPVGDHEPGDPS